jgi:hypothetical protein
VPFLLTRAHPLSGQRAPPDSADRPFSHSLLLARGPRPSEPSPQLPPCMTRAHAVDSAPMTHAEAAPTPTPTIFVCLHPTRSPPSLTHALAELQHLPRTHVHQRSPAVVRRGLGLVSRPWQFLAVSVASVSFASTPATRDAPRFAPSPLFLSARAHWTSTMQPESCCRRPEASPHPCHRSKVPEPSLEVTNLPLPLISPFLPLCVRNRSPKLSCPTTKPSCQGPPPSGASALVSCPRTRSLCRPEAT